MTASTSAATDTPTDPGHASARWKSIAALLVAATVTAVAADRLIGWLAPPDARLLQAEEGIAEVAKGDPSTIVLGSSHARSFQAVRDLALAEGTAPGDIAIVPDEGGQFIPYHWVLFERLKPLIDERNPDGSLRRPHLRHFVLVTTHYDLCELWVGGPGALPAHAWRWADFWNDVGQNGITDFNRNFLRARWNRAFSASAIMQDRGVGRVWGKLRWRLFGTDKRKQEAREGAREALVKSVNECGQASQKAAAEEMLTYLTSRNLDVVFVLFPLDTAIVSPEGLSTTIADYRKYVQELKARFPIRVVDLTTDHPLADSDFREDLDHLTPEGARHFAAWALPRYFDFMVPGKAAEGEHAP